MIEKIKERWYAIPAGATVVMAPAIALAQEGGSGSANSDITTAMTTMATDIAGDGVDMLTSIIPTVVPLVGAVILVGLGFKFVRKWMK